MAYAVAWKHDDMIDRRKMQLGKYDRMPCPRRPEEDHVQWAIGLFHNIEEYF